MNTIAISGSPRENVGKRDAKELRYTGKVPAVLYGGKEQIHFAIDAPALRDLVYTPEVNLVDLEIGGKTTQAIMQDIQFHPLTEKILHIDFLQLFDKKEVTIEIPVKLTGTSPGVKEGGKLVQKLRKLKVKALPKDMPQYVEVSIDDLTVGKSVRVRDLKPKGYLITNVQEDTVVSVIMSRALKQAEQQASVVKK
ncbi:MAG: 50S ribosomal protein L25/general stress protein Ctc [Bacteroidetes bacterium]|nr:50S ribosomal protein L25/general stress protein Ctc [Bacteroidota bacterium]MBU1373778.1 50S ribosomal protein L25/general stress protein Ctc [Bacteroidota bacterium]MBU1483825.1 50S ribosomal protein L25/general stress protein Ctc [Bacteroidota bacterium]MBU1760068.1 50S ribosomal protein L25/general stress protein Ctc [Bacteroidota bacterium]MBU2269500.1 50S ribosomal protein L25/general stress protein Ctc [Bacteroidota bacterium]